MENNNGNKNLLIAIIITCIILIFLNSCASRKVEKNETKEDEQTEIKISEKTETKIAEKTKIIDVSASDEIEFIPIDNTLPFIIKGETFKNVKIKHSKKKNDITTTKDIKVAQNKRKEVKTDIKRGKTIIEKKIERKSSYWWLLWFLLLIPIYILYRKFKDKFWFI